MGTFNHFLRGSNMKDFGVAGFILTVFSFLSSKILGLASYVFYTRIGIQLLQEIALYVTILVGVATLFWHLGNMLMKRKEFWKALKEALRSFIK